jgi:hypothetical protein
MQFMQQSPVPQPLQAFPDDPAPLHESATHPAHLQQPHPQSFQSFGPSYATYDSYQTGQFDPSQNHHQFYQAHNSYAPGSQMQQPPMPMGLMPPPQFNLANQHSNNHPGEFFDDPMMEYLTHLRDSRDTSGPSQQDSSENP